MSDQKTYSACYAYAEHQFRNRKPKYETSIFVIGAIMAYALSVAVFSMAAGIRMEDFNLGGIIGTVVIGGVAWLYISAQWREYHRLCAHLTSQIMADENHPIPHYRND
jgi:hypothetical protein